MNSYYISSFLLVTLALLTLARPRIDENLQHLDLQNKVQLKIGTRTEMINFRKLTDSDELKVDSDLAKFKIERISDAFISSDGKYMLTFAKDSDGKTKRILFFYNKGEIHSYADDVIQISSIEIKTSKGSISVAEGYSLLSD